MPLVNRDRENREGVRLSKDEIREKERREIYVRWVAIIHRRWENGECPNCGGIKWIQRGSGLHKKWICDKCGVETTRVDWVTGKKWQDYIELHAREEWYRRRKLKGDPELKNYERNKL